MCVLSREPQSFYKESLLRKVTPSFKHQYYVNLIQIWGALSPSGQIQYASGRDPISKACMLSWQLPPCPELLRSSCSSLALCSIFLFFWFLPHFVLLITVDGMATAFFFHVVWFTPLQSCYCLEKLPHFHLQHPFSHHFQFLQLLFHFGFHRNHMSLWGSISSMLAASATYWS